jgi:hypothetical protein
MGLSTITFLDDLKKGPGALVDTSYEYSTIEPEQLLAPFTGRPSLASFIK